ncbi:MAG: MCE family protein [Phycisphaerales bacterium]|nr:MCE family protein [Planctomycetota bacterium]MBL6996835.1 MCE family protein [Phycisphaerales bacterium]
MSEKTETAIVKDVPKKSISLTWIVPCIAIAIALALFARWKLNQGPQITITFNDANGLTTESPIMYRGTIVGMVEDITLNDTASNITVTARLKPSAITLAKEHSKWWIVRPSVSLQGIQGLDTVVGPRYIQVEPSGGNDAFTFIGLENSIPSQGKLFTLITASADNVAVGAPLFYRGIEVGSISSIGLSNTASTVQLQCVIQERYAPLIRTNTIFWNVSGIHIDANLLGIDLRAGPITSWIKGGISIATPNKPGDIAPEGYAFTIERDFDEDWIEWTPEIDLSENLEQQ